MLNLLSPRTIKELLAKYNAAPLKRLGQNFLISRGALEKIIEAANLNKEDRVLEVGPGIGAITKELARRAKKITAVEKDKKMVEALKETTKEFKNVEIIEGDVLKVQNSKLKVEIYKLVANLPHNIAAPVIRKFLEEGNKPEEMILMVQKEVAQRICSKPPEMSLLAVSVWFYADPKIIAYVSRGSFWPQPKVDSAIIRIVPKKDLPKINPANFFKVVRAGFSARRKQLAGSLTKKLNIDRSIIEEVLKKAMIKPSQRAETLSVEDWIKIEKYLVSNKT